MDPLVYKNVVIAFELFRSEYFDHTALNGICRFADVADADKPVQILADLYRIRKLDQHIFILVLRGPYVEHLKIPDGRYYKFLAAFFINTEAGAIPTYGKRVNFILLPFDPGDGKLVALHKGVMLPGNLYGERIAGIDQFFHVGKAFVIGRLNNARQLHLVNGGICSGLQAVERDGKIRLNGLKSELKIGKLIGHFDHLGELEFHGIAFIRVEFLCRPKLNGALVHPPGFAFYGRSEIENIIPKRSVLFVRSGYVARQLDADRASLGDNARCVRFDVLTEPGIDLCFVMGFDKNKNNNGDQRSRNADGN